MPEASVQQDWIDKDNVAFDAEPTTLDLMKAAAGTRFPFAWL